MSYGAVSFSGNTKAGPFYDQIWTGRKRQTMRKPRGDGRVHVKPGFTFRMYWRVRTPRSKKPVHYIGTAMCTGYRLVKLVDVWNDEENAIRDGFISLEEFRDWFLPDWQKIPYLDEVLKTIHEFRRSSRGHEVLVRWAQRMGRSTIVRFLGREYYVIEWDYPLVEKGKFIL